MNKQSKKIYLVSLGCAKNRVDSEVLLSFLLSKNSKLVNEPQKADILIVNTCGFLEISRKESIDTIINFTTIKKHSPEKKIIVTGCLVSLGGDELWQSIPEVDLVIGIENIEKINDILNCIESDGHGLNRFEPLYNIGKKYVGNNFHNRIITIGPGWEYLKISDGCNRHCSFCLIPKIKGNFISRQIDDIVKEAKTLADNGIKELVIVSQDSSYWGKDINKKLIDLIDALTKIDGIEWIRLLYLYPDLITPDLIKAFANEPKVVPYLDIPLQHIDNKILKLMRRGYTEKDIYTLLERIKKELPDIFLRTTFIVGHPGEGEKEFNNLKQFIKDFEFNHLGVFRYSDEAGTTSFNLENKVKPIQSYNRFRKLMSTQRKISRKLNKKLKGKILPIMVDGPSQDSPFLWEGRHIGQAPEVDGITYITFGVDSINPVPGTIIKAKIISYSDYDLIAQL